MADWMIWKDENNKIQVHCSECGYTLSETDPLTEKCPKCQSDMHVSMSVGDVIALMCKGKEN